MTTARADYDDQPEPRRDTSFGNPIATLHIDDGFPHPSAAMVLHRVLGRAARQVVRNDLGNQLIDQDRQCGTIDALSTQMGPRPLWAQSASSALDGTERGGTEAERIHQSRMALQCIRSNLRTFRLAFDPTWGTSVRAELAWYEDRLGRARDLHMLSQRIEESRPGEERPEGWVRLGSVVDAHASALVSDVAQERGGARRFQLTEQMMVLWDGPDFRAKTQKPAVDLLPALLQRAWHDLRGAARAARKDPSDAAFHKLGTRLMDLRYGCETTALAEGGPSRKVAKAAKGLEEKLVDLRDARFSIDWLEDLAEVRQDLIEPITEMLVAERQAAMVARKGWRPELKEVERRWRKWQG
jgi:CHAD domain-containing protein